MTFKFDFGAKLQSTGADVTPKEALKDSTGLSSHLLPNSSLLEVLASRVYYAINGCSYTLQENYVLSGLRMLGWGARLGVVLFAYIFDLMCMNYSPNPSHEYGLTRSGNASVFAQATFWIWIISLVITGLSYVAGRFGAPDPSSGCSNIVVVFCNRARLPAEYRILITSILLSFVALSVFAVGAAVHTVMAHTIASKNQLFSNLLVCILLCAILGSVADCLSVGGIDGLHVTSPMASRLASLNAVIISPILVIFTAFFCGLAMA